MEEHEKPASAYGSFTKDQIIEQFTQFDKQNRLVEQLKTIHVARLATESPQLSKADYWIIETTLNGDSVIKFHPLMKSQKEMADSFYRHLEQSPDCKSGKKQVVFISVDSVSKIAKAYPNFFGNTGDFVTALQGIIAAHNTKKLHGV